MVTKIDSNRKVYLVVDSHARNYFCNIEDLNEICKEFNTGHFKIYFFWNNKQTKVSKKDLKSFFEGSNLKQEFIY